MKAIRDNELNQYEIRCSWMSSIKDYWIGKKVEKPHVHTSEVDVVRRKGIYFEDMEIAGVRWNQHRHACFLYGVSSQRPQILHYNVVLSSKAMPKLSWLVAILPFPEPLYVYSLAVQR
jgi:hypothetical protein